jgi:penicillin-binding protein 2A
MRQQTTKQGKKYKAKLILLVSGGIIGALLLGGWGAFRMLVSAQDVELLDETLPAATIIYDREGSEATRISFNRIEEIGYADIPQSLIAAIAAVEDRRFWEHDGFDLKATGRALAANLGAGGKVQGGSTITQQLAKNVFLSHEKTWSRKWDELLLARKIEESYSKQDIMEMYLNRIYFGEGAWGIKRAAYVYFGKEPSALTVAESALLAGLVKAPSALTPYKHLDKATARRNVVLALMREQNLITEEVYAQAILEPIKLLAEKPSRTGDIQYRYYVDELIREAMAEYGLSENEVLEGGLRIYTELDPRMQQAAEQTYAKEELFPPSADDQLLQSASVLVDPRDGGIRALVGGRGDQPFRGFNRATQLQRQPGSAIKPLVVYAPALERGFRPEDTVLDAPIQIDGYSPGNADGRFHGEVTLFEALVQSYNVPAVKLLHEIGVAEGAEAAERFGISLDASDRTLAMALGGLQHGVSPLQMAAAYSVFASDGVRKEAHTIRRIESAQGELLAEYAGDEGVQVLEPAIAQTMNAMLQGVVTDGTGADAALDGRTMAAKSGTTQMPGTSGYGARDNWFVGYTPQLVGAVWLGYDQSDQNHYLQTSSKAAGVVLKAMMDEALKGEPVMKFPAELSLMAAIPKKNEQDNKNKDGKTSGKGQSEKSDKPDKGKKGKQDKEKEKKDKGQTNKEKNEKEKKNKDRKNKEEKTKKSKNDIQDNKKKDEEKLKDALRDKFNDEYRERDRKRKEREQQRN